jgi:hypothetical protein
VPTYQRLVRAAREARLQGATVLKAIYGFGRRGETHTSFWALTEQIPVIVELLDTPERIEAFIRGPVEKIMIGGMITLERAVVLQCRPRLEAASESPAALPATLQLPSRIQPLSTVPQFQDLPSGSHMTANENGIMLRVFLGESDRIDGKPLYEAIVQKVRELGLAGATVLRGSEGFGAHSVVHKSALLEMSTDLPVIVEIVDTEARINQLLPQLEMMVQGGMITMEYVSILLYRHAGPAAEDGLPDHPDAMP